MSSELLSVSEAAKKLGVDPSRIHARIREGSLPAEKVGNQWVITTRDLRLVMHHAGPGRPLSCKSAWALLAVAANSHAVAELSPPDRSKARARLRDLLADASSRVAPEEAVARIARALGNRAERRLFVASPRDLPDIRNDKRVQPSGVSLPESNISAGGSVEGYVWSGEVSPLLHDYLLSPASRGRANVVLHVVVSADRRCQAFSLDEAARSPLALAADLAEYDDVRERGEAMRLLAALQASTNAQPAKAPRG
ncbi:MAG: helix-turn-helix domain-containing protein [Micropruina sp.]|nr:helix-turn-helix domain-containing protein [Micropruina sp.]